MFKLLYKIFSTNGYYGIFPRRKRASEPDERARKDKGDQYGADPLYQEHIEGLGPEFAVLLDFVGYDLGTYHMAHEYAHKEGNDRHQEDVGDVIEEVQQVLAGDLDEIQRAVSQGDQDTRGESGDHHDSDRPVTGDLVGVHHSGSHRFQDGDRGGYGREGDHDEEEDGDDPSHAHASEDVGQGDEYESGTARDVPAHGCVGHGDDHESGDDGDRGIDNDDGERAALDVLFVAHIGTVGDQDSHGDGEREERLSQSCDEGLSVDVAQTELEVVCDTVPGTRQGEDIDGEPDEKYQEDRHEDDAESLDTLGDSQIDDDRDDDRECGEGDEALVRADEIAEDGGSVREVETGAVTEEISEQPAADDAVIRQDDGGHPRTQHTDDPEPLVQRTVRLDGASPGLPSDGDFGDHHGQSEQDDDRDVDEYEGSSSVFRGLGRESPDITQSHCGCSGGYDESRLTVEQAALRHTLTTMGRDYKTLSQNRVRKRAGCIG